MRTLSRACLLASFVAFTEAGSLHAATAGFGLTGLSLTIPNDGDSTFDPITDVYIDLVVHRRFLLGAAYSRFSVAYTNPYGDVETDQTVLSTYASADLFTTGPATAYFKIGVGWYTGTDAGDSESRAGAYAALGERLYVARRVSLNFEGQYHLASFGANEKYPPTGELFRMLLGVEVWTKARR